MARLLGRRDGPPEPLTSAETLRLFPKCPRCRRRMGFLLQLDSDLPTIDGQRWRWGSGGLLYVFHCVACRVDAQLWQCT